MKKNILIIIALMFTMFFSLHAIEKNQEAEMNKKFWSYINVELKYINQMMDKFDESSIEEQKKTIYLVALRYNAIGSVFFYDSVPTLNLADGEGIWEKVCHTLLFDLLKEITETGTMSDKTKEIFISLKDANQMYMDQITKNDRFYKEMKVRREAYDSYKSQILLILK